MRSSWPGLSIKSLLQAQPLLNSHLSLSLAALGAASHAWALAQHNPVNPQGCRISDVLLRVSLSHSLILSCPHSGWRCDFPHDYSWGTGVILHSNKWGKGTGSTKSKWLPLHLQASGAVPETACLLFPSPTHVHVHLGGGGGGVRRF